MTSPCSVPARPPVLSIHSDPELFITTSGELSGPFAEEAEMTVHRSRLHRSTHRRHARPDLSPSPVRRSRPAVAQRLLARLNSEQGDVPGWVLITLMTAGIVVALWAVASDQIVQIFQNAMAPFLGGSL